MAYQFHVPNYFPGDGGAEAYRGLINTLGGVAKDKDDERRFQIQEARQRAAEDFMRRQSATAEARQEEADRRQKIKERLEFSDRNRKQAGEVAGLIRGGRPQEAAAVARAGSYVDPETGEERSIQVDPGGESYDPGFENARLPEPMQAPPPARGLGSLLSGKLRAPLIGQDAPAEAPPSAGPTEPPPVGQENGAPVAAPPRRGLSVLGMGQQMQPPAIPTDQGKLTRRNPAMLMPGGERQEFDPREQQNYQDEQNQQRKAKLLEVANDPTMPPEVRRAAALRAGLTGAGASGAEGAQIMNTDQQVRGEAFKKQQQDAHDMTAEQKFKIGMRPRAAAGGPAAALKTDTANRQDLALLERHAVNMERSVGFKALDTQNKTLQTAQANFEGDSPDRALSRRDAMLNLATAARGGTRAPTDSEMLFLYRHLGGRLGNALPAFLADLENGDLTAAEKRNFDEALKSSTAEIGHLMDNAANAMRAGLKQGSGFENLQTNANAQFESRMIELGYSEEDIRKHLPFPGATEGVSLGSGERKSVLLPGGGQQPRATAPAAAAPVPAEGTVKTLSSGKTVIFQGGTWRTKR